MQHPYGCCRLEKLAKGKNKIVIIASDHTRPVPSRLIIPLMLEEMCIRDRANVEGISSFLFAFTKVLPYAGITRVKW